MHMYRLEFEAVFFVRAAIMNASLKEIARITNYALTTCAERVQTRCMWKKKSPHRPYSDRSAVVVVPSPPVVPSVPPEASPGVGL